MALPDYTTQTATAYKTNIDFTANDHETRLDTSDAKLAGIEAGATADQSNAEIKTAYEANGNTNVLTDAEKTKIANAALSGANTDITSLAGLTTDLAVAHGGTGSSTAAGALSNLGLTATAAELNILDGVTATAAELNLLDGATLKTKVIDIGDWNMNTGSATVFFAHGLTFANIRSVTALIRNDANNEYHSLPSVSTASTAGIEDIKVNSSNIILARTDGGTFNTSDYDSTTYNRGWVTIQYVG